MKSRNIKETFEAFSPSEEQKEHILKSILNHRHAMVKRAGFNFKAKLACSLAACLIMAAVAVMLINSSVGNSDVTLIEPGDTQYDQTNLPSENNSIPTAADKGSMPFKGFVLTAYSAKGQTSYLGADYLKEAEKALLTPDVKVLLARYTLAMSSVPGLAFTVDINSDEIDRLDIDVINVLVDSGELSRWDRGTGIVSSEGQSIVIGAGETIYWSPGFSEGAASIKSITITVEAVADNTVLGRQSIHITQDEPGYYYATAGDLELI